MTTVRELIAKFGLDFDARAFKKADSAIDGLKASATRLVSTLIALDIGRRIAHSVESVLDAADEASKSAFKFGLTTEKLQEMRFAADLAGISSDELERGLNLLGKKAGDAAIGNSEAAKSFAQIGVKVRDAQGKVKPLNSLMEEIADRMHNARDATERLRIAAEFFGTKGGGKFVALMKDGAEGMQEAQREAQELGGVFSGEFALQAEEFNDNLTRMKFGLTGIGLSILKELLPSLNSVSVSIIKWIRTNREFLKQKISEYVHAIANGIRTTVQVLSVLWKVLRAVVDTFGGFERVLKLVAAAMLINFVASVGQAVTAVGALSLRMLLTKAAMLADAFIMGAAFIILAGLIALVGEEIEALFNPRKQGLFESMAGKWGQLSDSLFKSAETASTVWGKALGYIGGAVSWVFNLIDAGFAGAFNLWISFWDSVDSIFQRIELIALRVEGLAKRFASFNLGIDKAAFGGTFLAPLAGIPADPAVQAAASQSRAVTNSVSVNVDASGQSLDEDKTASMITRQVENALTASHATALQALTPSFSQ